VRLAAHAIARVADRVPALRKVSRHLEGVESKSGLFSDVASLAYELYERNSEQIDQMVANYVRNVSAKAAARKAQGREARQSRFRSPKDKTVEVL
jgi:hypothetical protein